jgi:hypothetical protein
MGNRPVTFLGLLSAWQLFLAFALLAPRVKGGGFIDVLGSAALIVFLFREVGQGADGFLDWMLSVAGVWCAILLLTHRRADYWLYGAAGVLFALLPKDCTMLYVWACVYFILFIPAHLEEAPRFLVPVVVGGAALWAEWLVREPRDGTAFKTLIPGGIAALAVYAALVVILPGKVNLPHTLWGPTLAVLVLDLVGWPMGIFGTVWIPFMWAMFHVLRRRYEDTSKDTQWFIGLFVFCAFAVLCSAIGWPGRNFIDQFLPTTGLRAELKKTVTRDQVWAIVGKVDRWIIQFLHKKAKAAFEKEPAWFEGGDTPFWEEPINGTRMLILANATRPSLNASEWAPVYNRSPYWIYRGVMLGSGGERGQ